MAYQQIIVALAITYMVTLVYSAHVHVHAEYSNTMGKLYICKTRLIIHVLLKRRFSLNINIDTCI